ncbi:DNA-processing protein DprA [Streptococcus merionis]|uniref:DNA-processing chain A, smf family n=1 Tax=Streptococcus merionis TaxID=400065 RepID=A0A239SSK8_9STRE|nr:DNA-processing protein DprA [Streptococcus merionis]SNU88259.1 DNA-processing chain A, smf family [Streptococcus merionis]
MKAYDIFKWKQAGLTNLQINRILDYEQKAGKKLSDRDIVIVSEVKNPAVILEHYRNLDEAQCKERFDCFPALSILDEDYPLALREIYNPPTLLFYQGNLELLHQPKLAIVGSRNASKTGAGAVQKIVKELDNHFVIVSGLARGIDTAAHMAVLKNGGQTIAVIGTGLDVFYPKENRELQGYMSRNQLVLTEYEPSQQPLKFHFPERNRIIAGLASGVVVVEAKMRSGSLITCERAIEEGRDVFAVPGSILDGQSDGCHHLIREGAKCTNSGQDILSEYA